MSHNSNNSTNDQEVDLGQLFNAIGKAFDRFINFISSIFKSIFSVIIYAIRDFILNFKIIVGLLLLVGIIGYGIEKYREPTYESEMIVKTYFDSKYQLFSKINYFNTLLNNKNYDVLSGVFKIDEETASKIISFEIDAGPETESERILKYEEFLQGIDSTRVSNYTYEYFIENREITSGDLFAIKVESYKKDIFSTLGDGLNLSFENEYSSKKMKKRDSMLLIQKENLQASIQEVKQLQKIYIDVLEEEAQSTKASIALGDGFPLQQEKTETKEYQLLNQEIQLREELRKLEEEKIEENVFYEVISGFQEIGNETKNILKRYSLLFPMFVFALIIIVYFSRKCIKFVLNYE
ncbi:MAG: hypothetical protein HRT67_04975 [Flavobacteriaceae bacterium]|nr:hypothetical protein [Flavobacteriaceae bacterium]